jgi:hypothetical protein
MLLPDTCRKFYPTQPPFLIIDRHSSSISLISTSTSPPHHLITSTPHNSHIPLNHLLFRLVILVSPTSNSTPVINERMAITSPAVSNQDATPVTRQTITGAQRSLSAKEKPLNTAPEDANPEDAEPGTHSPLIPTASIPYFRSPRAQARTLPLRPEPGAPELISSPGTTGPETARAEAIQGTTPKQDPTAPPDVTIVQDIAAEEEGVAASEAERATFGYWRHPRATEPEKYAPAALAASQAAVKGLATAVTEKVEDVVSSVPAVVPQVLDDEDGPIASDAERATLGYWRHPRVMEPDKYAPAALANVATALKDVGSTVAGQLEISRSPVAALIPQVLDDEDGAVASDAERAAFGYWKHPRVTEPSKYAPAALTNQPIVLKGVGTSAAKDLGNLEPAAPVAIPQATYGNSSKAQPARKAASEHSPSEYSDDYRSSTISFHSSHQTLSSGQRKPLIGVRNAVSSPYL